MQAKKNKKNVFFKKSLAAGNVAAVKFGSMKSVSCAETPVGAQQFPEDGVGCQIRRLIAHQPPAERPPARQGNPQKTISLGLRSMSSAYCRPLAGSELP